MTVHGLRMQVSGGEGLVVAGPVAALFVADDGSDPEGHEFVSGLVEAVTAAPGAIGDPGPALVRRVGALVAGVMSRGAPTRPFALVAESADGVAVMIVGAVTVRYTGADGTQEALSGRDAAMWVDRIFHGTPTAITVGTDAGGAAPAHPFADLSHGAVGGGGFDLTGRDAAAAAEARHGAHAAPDEQGDVAAPRPKPRPVRDAVPADGVITQVDSVESTPTPGWEPVLPPPAEPAAAAEPEPPSPWEPVPSEPPSDPWVTPGAEPLVEAGDEPPVVAGPADSGPDEVGAADEPAWLPGGSPEAPAPEPAAAWSQPEPSAGWVIPPEHGSPPVEHEAPVPFPTPEPPAAEDDEPVLAPAGEFLAVDLDAPGAGGFAALPVTAGDDAAHAGSAPEVAEAPAAGAAVPAALHRQDGSTYLRAVRGSPLPHVGTTGEDTGQPLEQLRRHRAVASVATD